MFRLSRLEFFWFSQLLLVQFFLPANLCSAQTQVGRQVEQYLRDAQEAERSKDYERSAQAYLKILQIRPEWALIHQSLGVVYHLQSRYPEAIATFERALALDPKLWGSRLFLGMDYYRTNQFSKAIPELQEAIKLNPQLAEAEARFWLGSSHLALEQFQEAIEQFRRLVELKPGDLEALYNLAQTYSRFSSSLFKSIGEIDPESAEAHRLQAEWFESQDKLDNATEEYARVGALRPDSEGIHLAIGNIYLRQNKAEKAAEEFENELRIVPNDSTLREHLDTARQKLFQLTEPQSEQGSRGLSVKDPSVISASTTVRPDTSASPRSLGIEKFRSRQFGEATEFLEKALVSNPQDQQARLYLARCFLATENFHRSIETLQTAPKALGQDLESLYWLGKTYHELAALTLQKMIDINPSSYRVHQMSGELAEEKMEYSRALDSYQRTLKLSPDLAGIRFAIGNVYWKMQQLDEALVWLNEELARNPYHALANYKVGNIYMTKANPDAAIPYLEKAIQANPGMLVAQQDLGKAYMSKEQYQEAIARFNTVAARDPEDEGIHYLLSGAYKKSGRLQEASAELKKFSELRQRKVDRDRKYLDRKIRTDPANTR
jgi:tetratricopeptide (TPR) repeat protein